MKLSRQVAKFEKFISRAFRQFKKQVLKSISLSLVALSVSLFAIIIFITGLIWWPTNYVSAAYIAGINYYDFPIQIVAGSTIFQVPPFNTYTFELPKNTVQVSISVQDLNGQKLQTSNHSSSQIWWAGLDIWGKDLNSCGVINNISGLEYKSSNLAYGNISVSSKGSSVTLQANESPKYLALLNEFNDLPATAAITDSVWHVTFTTCTSNYSNTQVKLDWEYWRNYDAGQQNNMLNSELEKLNLLPDFNN